VVLKDRGISIKKIADSLVPNDVELVNCALVNDTKKQPNT
ncbi:MAG: hypothetical protein ACI8QQ_003079, partial [Psychroserpens sp.]